MAEHTFRIHPAIGIARVGNSEDYYIGPETMAGMPVADGGALTGGLPIKPGTESETITSRDLRDADGALKRQAARFRIVQYPRADRESYPTGAGAEVEIGTVIDGRTVADIVWTVHLANKKAACFDLDEDRGIEAYKDGQSPALRNLAVGNQPHDPARLKTLMIDPGPRTIRGGNAGAVRFDVGTVASYYDPQAGQVRSLADYPKSFPGDHFPQLDCPSGRGIESLGELRTDERGRLLVLGGYGTACGFDTDDGYPGPLPDDVNNDGWFDDVADGPVRATLVFDDGGVLEVQGVGWAVTTDPAFAPQILNVVTLWDEVFDTWVRTRGLCPGIYRGSAFDPDFEPSFEDDVLPIFRSAALQRWTTNLPGGAAQSHGFVGAIRPADDPESGPIFKLSEIIRDPDDPDRYEGTMGLPLMPLSLGDAGKSFLTVSPTQYFILRQWYGKKSSQVRAPKLGPGEFLDKAVLVNCLGGRFNPGIDMTFVVRDPDLYVKDWQGSGTGPFRINPRPLDYSQARPDRPFLSFGYIPLANGPEGLEPGDTSKFMAIPWHTDYNSCATHQPAPVPSMPPADRLLFWSWPAQRPVAVFVAKDVVGGQLPGQQRFSIRGEGTATDDPAQVGRYQCRTDILKNWQKIGFVIQASAIDGCENLDPTFYLEVESLLDDSGSVVEVWPNYIKTKSKYESSVM